MRNKIKAAALGLALMTLAGCGVTDLVGKFEGSRICEDGTCVELTVDEAGAPAK